MKRHTHSGTIKRRVRILALLLVGISVVRIPKLRAQDEGANNVPENTGKIAPLVIMENTALQGRIIFMQEENTDEAPGSNLRIAIMDDKKRKTLYETKTNDQGLYELPVLNSGIYWMQVGLLQIKLRVNAKENQNTTPASTNAPPTKATSQKPKILVVFLPRELV